MAGTMCKTLDSGAYPLLGLAAIAFVGGMAYDVGDAGPAVAALERAPRLHGRADGRAGTERSGAGLSVAGQLLEPSGDELVELRRQLARRDRADPRLTDAMAGLVEHERRRQRSADS